MGGTHSLCLGRNLLASSVLDDWFVPTAAPAGGGQLCKPKIRKKIHDGTEFLVSHSLRDRLKGQATMSAGRSRTMEGP